MRVLSHYQPSWRHVERYSFSLACVTDLHHLSLSVLYLDAASCRASVARMSSQRLLLFTEA